MMKTFKWIDTIKQKHVAKVEEFLFGSLSPVKFQSDYLDIMLKDDEPKELWAPSEVFEVLQQIFYDADAYSELVPIAIDEADIEIDEAELRRSVKENYDELIALLKQYEK